MIGVCYNKSYRMSNFAMNIEQKKERKEKDMEIMATFFGICAVIVGALWAYTESPKGKKWIDSL